MSWLADLRCPICGEVVTGSSGILEAPTMVVRPCGHEIPSDSARRARIANQRALWERLDSTGQTDCSDALIAWLNEDAAPSGGKPE